MNGSRSKVANEPSLLLVTINPVVQPRGGRFWTPVGRDLSSEGSSCSVLWLPCEATMKRQTKIGLCVSLALVGGCTALLLPAVHRARVAAQRTSDR